MLRICSTTILMGLLSLSATYAQSSQTLTARVPFAYTVQNQTLPAGDYRLTYTSTARRLLIARQGGEGGAMFALPQLTQGKTEGNARLVFRCYAGNCALQQVWSGLTPIGLEFPQAKPAAKVAFFTRVISASGKIQ